MAETLFGLVGKDFTLIAADQTAARSVIVLKHDEDKITEVDKFKMIAGCGDHGDRVQFIEYIVKNIHLYQLRTEIPLSTHAAAQFTRNQLAEALRKNPYQVNLLMGGYDEKKGPSLYYIDYLGSMHPLKKAAHGYGSHFALSVMDRWWKEDMTLEEAKDVLKKCIHELKTRFVLNLPSWKVKVVDKEGIRETEL